MITRWYNEDSIETVIASTYSNGKGYLFEIFFGLRENHNGRCRFVFSEKDWKHIDKNIKNCREYVKNS